MLSVARLDAAACIKSSQSDTSSTYVNTFVSLAYIADYVSPGTCITLITYSSMKEMKGWGLLILLFLSHLLLPFLDNFVTFVTL